MHDNGCVARVHATLTDPDSSGVRAAPESVDTLPNDGTAEDIAAAASGAEGPASEYTTTSELVTTTIYRTPTWNVALLVVRVLSEGGRDPSCLVTWCSCKRLVPKRFGRRVSEPIKGGRYMICRFCIPSLARSESCHNEL